MKQINIGSIVVTNLRGWLTCLLVILLWMCFCIQPLRAETSHPKVIRITNGEWEPYLSEYAYQYGLASHIVSEAFKLQGIDVVWGFFPWARSYKNAQLGEHWDASAVWWPTIETRRDFYISMPVVDTKNVFFYRKNHHFNWVGIEDLQGLTMGFTEGYDYGPDIMSAIEENRIRVEKVASDEQNFGKLLLKRIDIFPNDPVVGYQQLTNNFSAEEISQITHHPRSFAPRTLNLIISRNSPHGAYFLEQFNTGLETLKKSGRLDQMFVDLKKGKYQKNISR